MILDVPVAAKKKIKNNNNNNTKSRANDRDNNRFENNVLDNASVFFNSNMINAFLL